MAKRVFMIHGWGGGPEPDFFIWLRKELKNKGFLVEAPEMPNTETPVIEEWVKTLEKAVGKTDKDTYFIGHSIGCQTIIRYLQNTKAKAGGALLVAAWVNLANLEENEIKIAETWVKNPINFKEVKKNIGKTTVLISDNDPYNCLDENVKAFKEKLNANVIVKHSMEHFNNSKYDFILEEFLKLTK